jgi:hypothetical protein
VQASAKVTLVWTIPGSVFQFLDLREFEALIAAAPRSSLLSVALCGSPRLAGRGEDAGCSGKALDELDQFAGLVAVVAGIVQELGPGW